MTTVRGARDDSGYLRLDGLTRRSGPQFAADPLPLEVPRGDLRALPGPRGLGEDSPLRPPAGAVPHRGRLGS